MTCVKQYDRKTNKTLRVPDGTRTHGLPEHLVRRSFLWASEDIYGVTRDWSKNVFHSKREKYWKQCVTYIWPTQRLQEWLLLLSLVILQDTACGVQSSWCDVKWPHVQLLSNIGPRHVKFKYLNDNKCSKNHPGKFSQVPSHQRNEIVELMKKETNHYKNRRKAGVPLATDSESES